MLHLNVTQITNVVQLEAETKQKYLLLVKKTSAIINTFVQYALFSKNL